MYGAIMEIRVVKLDLEVTKITDFSLYDVVTGDFILQGKVNSIDYDNIKVDLDEELLEETMKETWESL